MTKKNPTENHSWKIGRKFFKLLRVLILLIRLILDIIEQFRRIT